jgi:serine/threonine protein kinase
MHASREADASNLARAFPKLALPLEFGPPDPSGRPAYSVQAAIGVGQSAEVYRGVFHPLSTDEQPCEVAIKFFREVTGEHHVRASREEAIRADRVRDDHVVRVRDIGLFEGKWPYVVSDYHDGQNLEEWAREAFDEAREPPAIDRCVTIVAHAARGVEAAHAKDVIHRDISPRNLLVGTDGVTRITDFGCASLGEKVGDTIVVGTPGFMPPEQWSRGAHLKASDIASLGGILYWLVTGLLPYGPNAEAIAAAHADPEATHRDRAIGLREANVPVAIADAILGAMHPDLTQRTTSAGGFAHQLEAWLESGEEEPRAIEPSSQPRQARRWRRRVLVSGLLVAAGMAYATPELVRPTPLPQRSLGECAEWFGTTTNDPAFATLAARLQDLRVLTESPLRPGESSPSQQAMRNAARDAFHLANAQRRGILAEPDPFVRISELLAIASIAYEADEHEGCTLYLASALDILESPEADLLDPEQRATCLARWQSIQGLRWLDARVDTKEAADPARIPASRAAHDWSGADLVLIGRAFQVARIRSLFGIDGHQTGFVRRVDVGIETLKNMAPAFQDLVLMPSSSAPSNRPSSQ